MTDDTTQPPTVEAAFEHLLDQIYPNTTDMDPQQRHDLRAFFFMGARYGFLAMVKGQPPMPAIAAELRTFGEAFLRYMTEQRKSLEDTEPKGNA